MPNSVGVQSMSDVAEPTFLDVGPAREQATTVIWHGESQPVIIDSSESKPHPERAALRRLARYHMRQMDCPFPPEV
jgi:hypothetical protein